MSLEVLAKYYRNYFESKIHKPKEEQIITKEEIVFKNPFLTVDDMFNDVLPVINSDQFYAISLVGPQGKGKTYLASIFGTKAKQKGFTIVYAKAEDILENTLYWTERVKELNADKLCFILDDMSYSVDTQSDKKQAKFKHFVAQIRHVFKAKVFVIYISHRLHSLPPMLRNSGSWIFASMQAADREDAIKLIARRKETRERLDSIYTFIGNASIQGPKLGKITYRVGEQELQFKWGTEENPGDGRLMVAYHSGEIKIFNSKIIEDMLDLEICRISPEDKTKPILLPEELEELSTKRKKEFKNKAEKLFPIPNEDVKALVLVKGIKIDSKI